MCLVFTECDSRLNKVKSSLIRVNMSTNKDLTLHPAREYHQIPIQDCKLCDRGSAGDPLPPETRRQHFQAVGAAREASECFRVRNKPTRTCLLTSFFAPLARRLVAGGWCRYEVSERFKDLDLREFGPTGKQCRYLLSCGRC